MNGCIHTHTYIHTTSKRMICLLAQSYLSRPYYVGCRLICCCMIAMSLHCISCWHFLNLLYKFLHWIIKRQQPYLFIDPNRDIDKSVETSPNCYTWYDFFSYMQCAMMDALHSNICRFKIHYQTRNVRVHSP